MHALGWPRRVTAICYHHGQSTRKFRSSWYNHNFL